MKPIDIRRLTRLALLTALLPVHALAQTASPPTPDAATARSAFAQPVATQALAGLRGGSEWVSSNIKLLGTTAGNTAGHVVTGNNAISAGSFANLNGIPLVIQNTGANVLIQNAVILQLQMN